MHINETSGAIVDSAIKVHRRLGPSLLEGSYEQVLAFELRKRGHHVRTQVPQSINYEGIILESCYKIDMLVDEQVIVELKTVDRLLPVHESQLMSYLVFSGIQVGLLINFRVALLRDGIKRIVNGLPE